MIVASTIVSTPHLSKRQPQKELINDMEIQMFDVKLVIVDDDDEKPLKKVDDPINTDSDSEVKEVFNETVGFMASTSSKVTIALEMVVV
ncbi:hypothetical protein Tco_0583840 [Tanacetum coccineum]